MVDANLVILMGDANLVMPKVMRDANLVLSIGDSAICEVITGNNLGLFRMLLKVVANVMPFGDWHVAFVVNRFP